MKVYIVEWFSAEPYSDLYGVEKVFYHQSDAQKFIDGNSGVILDADEDGYGGRMISSLITEYTVE